MGLRSGDWAGHRMTSNSWSSNHFLVFLLVFWVTILLEDDITGGFAIIIQSPLKFIPQDVAVEIRIHDPINFASQASPFPSHAAPHHNRTTPKLPGPLH